MGVGLGWDRGAAAAGRQGLLLLLLELGVCGEDGFGGEGRGARVGVGGVIGEGGVAFHPALTSVIISLSDTGQKHQTYILRSSMSV